MNTREKMKVMQAFEDGADIQVKRDGEEWSECRTISKTAGTPTWSWGNFQFRTKPEPTLLERIEAKWPNKIIEPLLWEPDLCLLRGDFHTNAPSIKGFDGYVYDFTGGNGGDLTMRREPVYALGNNKLLHPVAVLFSK